MATIKTTYDIGQSLWTLQDGKAKKFTVGSIVLCVTDDHTTETVTETGKFKSIDIDKCFQSRDELIAHIFDGVTDEA